MYLCIYVDISMSDNEKGGMEEEGRGMGRGWVKEKIDGINEW